jgi:hypothetical protein
MSPIFVSTVPIWEYTVMASAIAPKKPVPPPAAVGAPAAGKVEKPAKPKKIDFPGLFVGEPGKEDYQKLDAMPVGFDAKLHKPLRKKDFKDESLFLEYQASLLDVKASNLRAHAAKLRTVGASGSSAKAKTLVKMQARMAELMAALKAEGMDVDALLATK